ncbi:helix-turn-helix transcriptional regulator [Paenibacillus macerans]|uniref:helix-turn-helix transcriptional regulator n=1 Tax=Paenibacillus macerans TaxID=44252 RepID=UPI0022E3D095|nr:helix-turn-helix transcriptional regulator [Paenibacillus macerans]
MVNKRKNLITARKNKGLTQDELASQADISRAYLSNIERGAYAPSLKVARRLSQILKLSTDELFFGN